MERQLIDDLLEKYLAGNTNLTEEQQLRDYFINTVELPVDLLPYKDLFSFFVVEQKCSYEGDILLPKRPSYKKYFAIAAVMLVLITTLVWQPFQTKTNLQKGDAHVEAQNAKGLLMMFGRMPQESQQNLNYIEELKLFKLDEINGTLNDSTDASLEVKRITQR